MSSSPAADPPDAERLLSERAWLRSLARSLVVDAASADDLAQDAVVVALTRPPRDAGALRGWLRKVSRNLASNARRGAARREARETAAPPRGSEDPADVVARWEVRRRVVDAVLALDEPYRTTLLLRFFEGLEVAEIAARLGVPPDTVKTRQRRALDVLRARLADLDDGCGRRGLAVLVVLAEPDAPPAQVVPLAASLGGLAMAGLTKVLVAGVVVATAAAAWWVVRGDEEPGRDAGAASGARTGSLAPAAPAAARARAAGDAPRNPLEPADAVTAARALDFERDLHGVVVDAADRPVAGAEVRAHAFDSAEYVFALVRGDAPACGAELATGRSGADGAFALRVAPGAETLLHVRAAGFADAVIPRVHPGPAHRVVMAPPGELQVRVADAAAAPVAGALVQVLGAVNGRASGGFVRAGRTGADGVVSWSDVPARSGALLVIEVVPGGSRAPLHANRTLADAPRTELVLHLPAGRELVGRVVDAATGGGLPGARIGRDVRGDAVAVAGADGAFAIRDWPSGAYPLRFVAALDGYAPARLVVPDGDAPVRVVLARGYEVVGRLVAGADAPVAGATIVAPVEDGGEAVTLLDARSGADGAFRIGRLPPGPARLLVRASGHGTAWIDVPPPGQGAETVDVGAVRLAAGRRVRGRAVGEDGRPLADRGVRLVGLRHPAGGFEPRRTTAPDGSFVFAEVAPGAYRAELTGGRPAPSAEVVVREDADPEPLTLVTASPRETAPKAELRARFVDETGRPVAGVGFSVLDAAQGGGEGTSSADGTAQVPCADVPQALSLRLSPDLATRFLWQHVWLRPGQTDVRVVLQAAEPVAGAVVDAGGNAVAGAWVVARIQGRQVGHALAGSDGAFAIGIPRGAVVDLQATPPAAPLRSDVAWQPQVAAGTSGLVLRVVAVPLDRTLTVDLGLREDEDVVGRDVHADFAGANPRMPVVGTFDARGRVVLEGLPRGGPVQLRVFVRRAAAAPNDFTGLAPVTVDGATTAARLAVPPLRAVRGRVVAAVGGAASPGAILFSTAAGNASQCLADGSGAFVLHVPSDAPTPFLVSASAFPFDPKAPRSGWDLVEDASDRELEIVLRDLPPR